MAEAVAGRDDRQQEITQEFLDRYYNEHLRFGFAELEKSKGCRLLQIFARNTECCQSERASLASCKKLHHNRANRSAIRCREINASHRLNRGRDHEAASLSL